MARTSPSDGGERLFVALDLPDRARLEIARWRDRMVADERLRPVPAAALHLTLAFLGRLPGRAAGEIQQAIGAACDGSSAPELCPQGLVGVPARRPRLVALDLLDLEGAAGRLQRVLSHELERRGLYTPDERPFWPHLTLARVRGKGTLRVSRERAPERPFATEAVVLYRSLLRRDGARYEPLARVELGPARAWTDS